VEPSEVISPQYDYTARPNEQPVQEDELSAAPEELGNRFLREAIDEPQPESVVQFVDPLEPETAVDPSAIEQEEPEDRLAVDLVSGVIRQGTLLDKSTDRSAESPTVLNADEHAALDEHRRQGARARARESLKKSEMEKRKKTRKSRSM